MVSGQNSQQELIEVQSIFFNKENTLEFITQNFETCKFTFEELIESNHPLLMHKFNRKLIKGQSNYTLFGSPINDLYSYIPNSQNNYALYFTMDIDKEVVDKFIHLIGLPENVDSENLLSGDYDFLFWAFSDLQIFINKNGSLGRVKNNCLVGISRLEYERIWREERL